MNCICFSPFSGYLKSGHIIQNEYSNDVLSLEVQEQQHLREARELRQQLVEHLWKITEELNILYKDNWTALANREVIKFQKGLLNNGMWRPPPMGGVRRQEADYQSVSMDHRRNEIQVVLANAEREAKDGPTQSVEPGGALASFTWNFFSSFLYSLSLVTTVGEWVMIYLTWDQTTPLPWNKKKWVTIKCEKNISGLFGVLGNQIYKPPMQQDYL